MSLLAVLSLSVSSYVSMFPSYEAKHALIFEVTIPSLDTGLH